MTACLHCGQPALAEKEFCCRGCDAAYHLIHKLGLGKYYDRRVFDEETAALRPDEETGPVDFTHFVASKPDGECELHLMVEGVQCGACVWLIESLLNREPSVRQARVNMSTRRLMLRWQGEPARGNELAGLVMRLGYRLHPFDPAVLKSENSAREKALLKAMAIAGFAAGNLMLFSVALWSSEREIMGGATRDLFHWISALIALPTIAYAGRPFFHSALTALRNRRSNMDVPISLALILTAGMSLWETIRQGEYVYFDSATMLLFFLLVGRYLDSRARGQARRAAEDLLQLMAGSATVLTDAGSEVRPIHEVEAGMTVLCAVGEKAPADGEVIQGESELDTSLITGETLPRPVEPGSPVYAGMINLSAPLRLRVSQAGEGTLLSEIVRLMERAEQGQARYVRLADRAAKLYTPVVHSLGLVTFAGWMLLGGVAWQQALLIAVSVLIITCPCALGLAVPVVQVLASGRLMRRGILLKSADALERAAGIDMVVFDKTGTLTRGSPELMEAGNIPETTLQMAASLASHSKHPLSRALCAAYHGPLLELEEVTEQPGAGLEAKYQGKYVRLGKRGWCGVDADEESGALEFWLAVEDEAPVAFRFEDALRPDAKEVVTALKTRGMPVLLLSGDRRPVVEALARELGIEVCEAEMTPDAKYARLEQLNQEHKVMMVGDGLNDAAALARAEVSLSPSSAMHLTQNAADVVFQGERLQPVLEVLEVAARSERLVKQNLAMAAVYNMIAVPVAMAGWVTPMVAALAMSGSSLVVIVNALRLTLKRGTKA